MSNQPDFSRRDLLRRVSASLAAAAAAGRVLPAQEVQHVHQAVADEHGAAGQYQPKALTAHEYATLQRLAEWIVPGATEAHAADFLDFLCAATDDMKRIYTGGLAWLDDRMQTRFDGRDFLEASPDQQKQMLDLIAFREGRAKDPSLAPGIEFFSWARAMVVDAYYTSPIGMFKELNYMGNRAMEHFTVPQAAIDYAIKHSPFA